MYRVRPPLRWRKVRQTGPATTSAVASGLPMWSKILMAVFGLLTLAFIVASAVIHGNNAAKINDKDECARNPCSNGGTCIDLLDGFICKCATGWTGVTCASDINECETSPCQHGGICNNFQNGQFSCTCGTHFTGPLCVERIYYCSPNPCKRGKCSEVKDNILSFRTYVCHCDPGWEGTTCNIDIDECRSSPCGAHGSCKDGDNDYSCDCIPGYTGTHCETKIDKCAISGQNPCLNGICVDGLHSYTCKCFPGFEGTNCEIDIDECASNPCAGGVFEADGSKSVGMCLNLAGFYRCSCSLEVSNRIASASTGPIVLDEDCQISAVPLESSGSVIVSGPYGR